jgi:hypothetical protein
VSGPDYTLYRFFDGRGALLYVGITKRGWSRAEEHAQRKHWWPRVDHAKFEHYRGLDAAHNAEKRAIAMESPEFNLNHVGAKPPKSSSAERPERWHVKHASSLKIPDGMPNPAETPTLPIWPDAGRLMGLQSKSAAYRAAKDGYMPTVRVSERGWVVPTATLMAMLGFSEEAT